MTRFEWIQDMDESDLAEFLCNLMCADCCESRCPARGECNTGNNAMRKWLESEVDEDG